MTSFLLGVLLLYSAAQAQFEDDSVEVKQQSFGVGLGIPYGVLGINLDINLVDNLNLTGGLGHTLVAGLAYNVGLKYFLRAPENVFRPRVSIYYGINSAIERIGWFSWSESEVETYAGLSVGFGAQWMLGRSRSSGFDFDVIILATTDWGDDLLQLEQQGVDVEGRGKVKFSLGYRHSL